MLGLVYLMPDCWLEVSLHPEGPATGQLKSRFSVVFLGPRANTEFVPKFPMVTLKISSYTNVTLTFNSDFGLDHLDHGGYG
jgi:hypothetical protein